MLGFNRKTVMLLDQKIIAIVSVVKKDWIPFFDQGLLSSYHFQERVSERTVKLYFKKVELENI